MGRFWFLPILAGLVAGCATGPGEATRPLQRSVPAAYGIEGFQQVEAIRYTFNVRLPDREVRRSWIWWPGEDRVTSAPVDGGDPVTYRRSELAAGAAPDLAEIDARFINDRYWLVFPFELAWDDTIRTEDRGEGTGPLTGRTLRHLVVYYPPTGGYTPGDVYELFADGDGRLAEWIYRKGGSPTPTRTTTWEAHRRAGPILVATDHKGPGGDFRVWFTDVAVKVKGDDRWQEAAP